MWKLPPQCQLAARSFHIDHPDLTYSTDRSCTESSENEDDHFSDASEGRESRPASPSTRLAGKYKAVRHSAGHDRGNHSTLAPQEQESGALGAKIGRPSQGESDEHVSSSPQEPVVPTTVVEKVDPFTASYGEVPGTAAYDMRRADAEPDVVVASDEADGAPQGKKTVPPNLPVPITKVTTIDSSPGHGDIPGTEAHEKHKGDAEPDVVEHQVDPQGTRRSPMISTHNQIMDPDHQLHWVVDSQRNSQ